MNGGYFIHNLHGGDAKQHLVMIYQFKVSYAEKSFLPTDACESDGWQGKNDSRIAWVDVPWNGRYSGFCFRFYG
jgi:hypothetical protein